MLRSRVIPVLLIEDDGLVKTRQFKNPKYVGDPLNAVRVFNEKEVDELIVLSIKSSFENKPPNIGLIENLAYECCMPLCYGGGIKNVQQSMDILSLGVEKVAFGSLLFENPSVITEVAEQAGSQSVVAVLDYKKKIFGRGLDVRINSGNRAAGSDLLSAALMAQDLGVGELVLNSIDRDGMMSGYDIDVVSKLRKELNIPITVCGGAGSLDDIERMCTEFGPIGAAAGSLFVFNGKYRAVLIDYPAAEKKIEITKKI